MKVRLQRLNLVTLVPVQLTAYGPDMANGHLVLKLVVEERKFEQDLKSYLHQMVEKNVKDRQQNPMLVMSSLVQVNESQIQILIGNI